MTRNPSDRCVSMEELDSIWDECKAKGILYNGMTHVELRKRYGDRVYHVAGDGWYVHA